MLLTSSSFLYLLSKQIKNSARDYELNSLKNVFDICDILKSPPLNQ